MTDREKVIKGLKAHGKQGMCTDCPYFSHDDCSQMLADDVLELLKEQEALEPVEMIDDFYPIGDPLRTVGWKCGKCMERVAGYDNYCPNCRLERRIANDPQRLHDQARTLHPPLRGTGERAGDIQGR